MHDEYNADEAIKKWNFHRKKILDMDAASNDKQLKNVSNHPTTFMSPFYEAQVYCKHKPSFIQRFISWITNKFGGKND